MGNDVCYAFLVVSVFVCVVFHMCVNLVSSSKKVVDLKRGESFFFLCSRKEDDKDERGEEEGSNNR